MQLRPTKGSFYSESTDVFLKYYIHISNNNFQLASAHFSNKTEIHNRRQNFVKQFDFFDVEAFILVMTIHFRTKDHNRWKKYQNDV